LRDPYGWRFLYISGIGAKKVSPLFD